MQKLIFIVPSILALSISTACAAKSEIVQKTAIASQSYIKPGAGIGYAHDLKSQYNAGDTVTFQLNLGESYDAGTMRVNVSAEGVRLLESNASSAFDMGAGGEHEMRVSFTADSNGRHYINVHALADIGDGNPMSRVFSLPVQVGPVIAQKPNPDMKTMPDGENIIEMEAQEVIK